MKIKKKKKKRKQKKKKKGWGDKRTENSDKIDFIIFVT